MRQFEGYERLDSLNTLYLEKNEVPTQIKARLAAGNRCYYSFQKLLRFVTRHLKLSVYKTIIIKLVVLYCSETWTLGTFRNERFSVRSSELYVRITNGG